MVKPWRASEKYKTYKTESPTKGKDSELGHNEDVATHMSRDLTSDDNFSNLDVTESPTRAKNSELGHNKDVAILISINVLVITFVFGRLRILRILIIITEPYGK